MNRILTAGFTLLLLSTTVFAQHRGDKMFFQGLDYTNNDGTRSLAMGGAFSANTGDINAIFYNPAGLADLKKISIAYYGNSTSTEYWENQSWKPTKYLGALSLYLEELLHISRDSIFTHEYNDIDIFKDSAYVISNPKMGLDPYSKEAAKWTKKITHTAPLNIVFALPLHDYVEGLVVGGSFNQNYVADYDRNDTYLTPHPGYTLYDTMKQASNDMQWYRYYRSRTGMISTTRIAVSYQINKNIQVGAGLKYINGRTEDFIGLQQYGTFTLAGQNVFSFNFHNYLDITSGNSTYKSLSASLGLILSYSKFNLGLTLTLPSTLERKFNSYRFVSKEVDNNTVVATASTGTDKMKMPLGFTIGINYAAAKSLTLACDVEYVPYGTAEFQVTQPDFFFQHWVNQTILRVGLEYRVTKELNLSVGYRNIPQSYVPDGSAIKDRGPIAVSYTFGTGYNLNVMDMNLGRIDIVYEYSNLNYYDSYYSNTNYNTIRTNRIVCGYTYGF